MLLLAAVYPCCIVCNFTIPIAILIQLWQRCIDNTCNWVTPYWPLPQKVVLYYLRDAYLQLWLALRTCHNPFSIILFLPLLFLFFHPSCIPSFVPLTSTFSSPVTRSDIQIQLLSCFHLLVASF
ncbi:hypothetical protein BDV29DRAFT_12639 [Aspergillus leporis]|uniref:Uncharacterized protein n=1 Tax=Aspergillus leporis TaxID=41062 RepID=A0A5N5WVH1_9EURO|nr:hypothetical protein BDV29DRAFT_12639 [Aspergillus leporis]